jgi:hypothetical protein
VVGRLSPLAVGHDHRYGGDVRWGMCLKPERRRKMHGIRASKAKAKRSVPSASYHRAVWYTCAKASNSAHT